MENGNAANITPSCEIFRSEIRQRFAELKKMLRDFQAEFLEAFCSYAQRNDERIGAVERDLAAMKNGLDVIESRTTEVERRLNTPPQA